MDQTSTRPTSADLISAARDLGGVVEEQALATSAQGRMLDQHFASLRDAGLFKVLQPEQFGGYQYDLHTHLHTIEALGRGCGSTAWVTGVYQAHSWLMGLFPEQAQADVYAENPDAVLAGVLGPTGTAKVVGNGFILNGRYGFCSGCHHADWLMFGALVHGSEDEVIDAVILLVKPNEVTIKDDWDVGGLAGTGSNTVLVQDALVPTHRCLSIPPAREGKSPGIDLHDHALYRTPIVPALTLFLCGSAIGIARGACENFKRSLAGRQIAHTDGQLQADLAVTHIELAEAVTKTDTARLLLHDCVDRMDSVSANATVMDVPARARIRMDCAFAMRLCLEATELLYIATGGRGLANSSLIQLASRDLHAINMHGLLTLKTNLEMYGRVLLDLPPNSQLV